MKTLTIKELKELLNQYDENSTSYPLTADRLTLDNDKPYFEDSDVEDTISENVLYLEMY